MADSFDIQAAVRGDITITPEVHPDDRAARLKSESRRDLLRDCKDVAVFAVLLLGVVAIAALAAYESIWDAGASPETKRWSQTILSAVLAGGVSFVAGQKIGSK